MPRPEKLRWADVSSAAEVVFSIWVGHPEIRWAKAAWRHIINAGLADYANELEYCKVCLRFFAMADIYYDWCSIAWDEDHSDEAILDASEYFEMHPFRLGQLIGPKELIEKRITQDELLKSAICALVGTARTEVVDAIRCGFGGTIELFISLLNSNTSRKEDMITEPWELNYLEVGLSTAYGWIEDGCPPWRTGAMGLFGTG